MRVDLAFGLVPRAADGRPLDRDEGFGKAFQMAVKHLDRVGVAGHLQADLMGLQPYAKGVVVGMHIVALHDQRRRVAVVELLRHGPAEESAFVLEIVHILAHNTSLDAPRRVVPGFGHDVRHYMVSMHAYVIRACKVVAWLGFVAQRIERSPPERKVVGSTPIVCI